MEPLAALGMAAAIAQFTDFTAKLVCTSSEIFRDASGASANNMALEAVYSKLQEHAESLGNAAAAANPRQSSPARAHADARLSELSAQCKNDCDALLETLDHFKVKPGGKKRLWKSMKAGLGSVWKRGKISELDERLQRSQRLMTLYVVNLVKYGPVNLRPGRRRVLTVIPQRRGLNPEPEHSASQARQRRQAIRPLRQTG